MAFPRVEQALIALFAKGEVGTKESFARLVFADPKTVYRILRKLHLAGTIRICLWVPQYKQLIPKYCSADGMPDVKKPGKIPDKVSKARYRKSHPEFRVREAAKKRRKRTEAKVRQESPPELGTWLSALAQVKPPSKLELKHKEAQMRKQEKERNKQNGIP